MKYRGIAMTVSGSDSGGGGGIQADLKTFSALQVFGTSAVTAITDQNNLGGQAVHNIPSDIVLEQMRSVLSNVSVGAVKTGMLSGAQIVTAVCEGIRDLSVHSLVVDPVIVSPNGDALIADQAVLSIKEELLPLASLVTPGVHEAERLSGLSVTDIESMIAAASAIASMGPQAVFVKGDCLEGDIVTDVLWISGKAVRYESPRIDTAHVRGTRCILSAVITAELAAGCELQDAVRRGRVYLQSAVENGVQAEIGHGMLGHLVSPDWLENED